MSTIQDTAKGLFEKGYSTASSMAETAKLKMKILDQSIEYDNLMKKLGMSVYEEAKKDPRYTEAYPALFKKIEEVSERKRALEDELSNLKKEADIKAAEAERDTNEEAKAEYEIEEVED